jgi:2'-5' RNA ligase
MPPDSLRLFIAIELPTDVCEALAALQKQLQPADRARAIRWSAISSIHLTLKFLGDTPSDRVPTIELALQEATKGHKSFELHVDGAGCFPDMRRPRVVWAGVGGDLDSLHTLRDAVERTVSPLGYPTEARPFSAHLTLGRARQEASRDALAAIGRQVEAVKPSVLASWHVEGISLMRSELKPSGAVYKQVAHVALNK